MKLGKPLRLEEMFVIQPAHPWWRKKTGTTLVHFLRDFAIRSDNNPQWLTAAELYELVDESAPR